MKCLIVSHIKIQKTFITIQKPISITNAVGVYQSTNVVVGKAEQQHIENVVVHHINADVSVGADIQLTQTPTMISVEMKLSNPWYSAYIVQENIEHTIKVFELHKLFLSKKIKLQQVTLLRSMQVQ